MAKLRPEVTSIPLSGELHKFVLEAIRQRYFLSRFYMSGRYETWSKLEERYMAYVNLTENDKKRNALKTQGKPQYVTIDIPYSYAMLLTAHTYWTSVFLSRIPVMQYQALQGGGVQGEQAVETLINYQIGAGQMLLPLYLWLMDAGKYGLGILGNSWCEEQNVVTTVEEVQASYLGIPMPGKTKKVRKTMLVPGYKGNKCFNIRPQDFFPDPRVPIYRLQEGEFCGHFNEVGWNTIVKREAQGYYFNVEEMRKRLKSTKDFMRDRGSPQLVLPASMDTLFFRNQVEDPRSGNANNGQGENKSFVELFEITIELIPRDWGLGNSTYPEKWNFTVGNMEVILNAMPIGSIHDKFEYFPLEYEIEGYSLSKRSLLEIVDPLNDVMSWLFNSHMYNVRKTINDQMIVDPSRIVMKDLTDPTSGRIIRLKPEAYGTPAGDAVHQLQVVDVTQQNVRDISVVGDVMQRVLGVNDNVMGVVNDGGRKTATEVRSSSTFGINRLKTISEYMSAMGFTPFGEVLLANTQQRYDQAAVYRIAGTSQGDPFMSVTPEMIAGKYQYEPIDGSMPVDRFAQANLWKEIMSVAATSPMLGSRVDLFGMLAYIAQLSGMKNFNQFEIKTNVVPDEAAAAAAQAGNAVPIGGGGGQSRVGGAATAGPGVPGTPSVPGVGPVG